MVEAQVSTVRETRPAGGSLGALGWRVGIGALLGRVTVNRRCSRFGNKIAGLPTDHRRVR